MFMLVSRCLLSAAFTVVENPSVSRIQRQSSRTQNLVKDLEEARDISDFAGAESKALVVDTHALGQFLDRADVSVGTEQNLLEMGLFDVPTCCISHLLPF